MLPRTLLLPPSPPPPKKKSTGLDVQARILVCSGCSPVEYFLGVEYFPNDFKHYSSLRNTPALTVLTVRYMCGYIWVLLRFINATHLYYGTACDSIIDRLTCLIKRASDGSNGSAPRVLPLLLAIQVNQTWIK